MATAQNTISYLLACSAQQSGCFASRVRFLWRIAALDSAVVFSLLGNATAACLGTMNAVLVAHALSQSLQGFFYTFGSLVTLYVFLEFGIGQVVIQFASYEWGRLTAGTDKGGIALSRIASLWRICIRWYSGCGLLVLGVIGPMGYAFFGNRGVEGWLGPWLLLCAGVSGNLFLTPTFLFIQACATPRAFWFYRLMYQLVYGLTLGCSIYLGAELWSAGVATWIGLLWGGAFATRYAVPVQVPREISLSSWGVWFHELWPLQWRAAMTWLSSYYTIPLLILVAFHYGGPVLAGQIGLSGTASVLILAFAASWVVTRAPTFGILIGQGKYLEAERLLMAGLRVTLIVAIGGGSVLGVGVCVLNMAEHPLAERLVQPSAMGLLLVGMVLQAIFVSIVTYIRAHKEEPLGVVSVMALVVTVGSAVFGIPAFGAIGLALAYLAGLTLVQMPTALWCLARVRSRIDL